MSTRNNHNSFKTLIMIIKIKNITNLGQGFNKTNKKDIGN